MLGSSPRSGSTPERGRPSRALLPWLIVALAAASMLAASPALAGQASSGELFFYPCDSCHPVTMNDAGRPDHELPIEFSGHQIVLEGHDVLGEGSEACTVCHEDAAANPGVLKLVNGGLVEITGDVSQVCFQCHSDKYKEFVAGDHGHLSGKCTDAGCHDPHSPGYIHAGPLLPFVGSGFQFKVLSEREAFQPLAPPAPIPAHTTPTWFAFISALGVALALGMVSRLVRGRQKR